VISTVRKGAEYYLYFSFVSVTEKGAAMQALACYNQRQNAISAFAVKTVNFVQLAACVERLKPNVVYLSTVLALPLT